MTGMSATPEPAEPQKKTAPPLPVTRRLRYMIETVCAYAIYGFFRILPVDMASGIGAWVLGVIGPRMGVTRVAQKNLDLAFPEKTAAEKTQVIKEMWQNLGRVIAEYPHLDRIWQNVELVGKEHLNDARDSGAAVIFWSGHLGNWEVTPMAARKHGIDIQLVYRKPNNPGVDGLLRHARAKTGAAGYIAKGAAGAREIFSCLRKKGAVGILIDQKLSEGVAVPFFGQEAMTTTAVAQFALRLGCRLYPTRVERLDKTKMRVTIYPQTPVPSTGDAEADLHALMGAMNGQLEDWIRARPQDWLWIHKRWG